MALKPEAVESIAALARLALASEQISQYQRELSAILDLAAELERAEVDGVEPLAHPLDATQRLRIDVAEPGGEVQRERLQRGAPDITNGLYLVPKVIE